jgi:hypothetical protein
MKIGILIVLFMCFAKTSLPQRSDICISGYCIDAQTDTPLEGVFVLFIDKLGRDYKSDLQGVFIICELDIFDPLRKYRFSFLKSGYKPIIDTLIQILPDGTLPNAIKLMPTHHPAYHAYYGLIMDSKVNFLPTVDISYFCERRWSQIRTNESGLFYFEVSDNCKTFIEVIIKKNGYKTFSDTLKGTDKLHIINLQPQNVSLVNYTEFLEARKKKSFQIGAGFGLQASDSLIFSYIPRDIRLVQPHDDDLKDRREEILDPDEPDNYLVYENNAFIKLPGRKNIDLFNLSFYGLVNLTLRTSTIGSSKEVHGYNFYRKNYIKPEYYGFAYIYYSINTAERGVMGGRSLSLPVYFTLPVFYLGANHEVHNRVIFGITGGSNVFWPSRIEVVAENGWDRFGSLEINEIFHLGEIKEIEWFWGVYFEGILFHYHKEAANSLRINCQFTLIHPDYRENFTMPMRYNFDNRPIPSFRIGVTMPL